MADVLDERFSFYVHLDRKSNAGEDEMLRLRNHPRVKCVLTRYNVNWAGVHHLYAIIDLLQEAMKSDAKIFHAISGQDFPIKSSDEMDAFFKANPNKQFIEHFALPAGHWTNGGLHRIWYWYFYDWFDNKTRFGHFMNRATIKIQKVFGVKRKWPEELPALFGGGTWWSITRECAAYTMNYSQQHPELLKRLRFTLCPEEEFFQTIIMNSEFASEAVSDHLRYIDWHSRNGNAPANLDESDFEKIMSSGKLFARKFDYPVSESVVSKIALKLQG
jgi:hypothetical protein